MGLVAIAGLLAAIGGGAGVAALVKALSDRKTTPRTVAQEESEAALRIMGSTVENVRDEMTASRAEADRRYDELVQTFNAARAEFQARLEDVVRKNGELRGKLETMTAENMRLRSRVAALESEVHRP